MSEKTKLMIDYLKLKLHVNMDNSFEEALKLTQKETSKKNIRPTQGQPITPDIYGKLYPDLSATEIVKSIRETKLRKEVK